MLAVIFDPFMREGNMSTSLGPLEHSPLTLLESPSSLPISNHRPLACNPLRSWRERGLHRHLLCLLRTALYLLAKCLTLVPTRLLVQPRSGPTCYFPCRLLSPSMLRLIITSPNNFVMLSSPRYSSLVGCLAARCMHQFVHYDLHIHFGTKTGCTVLYYLASQPLVDKMEQCR